ncbi:type II toxin-antitoxin system VapC family toxin [Moraxella bovis]|uniref:type II toxin-antitoxin system VapC family toxin n=1 Tax=Moraxella bovis TaxID=476 RepID=UPI0022275F8C|nr:type II toxin-antitoxin system VapC family toxin [Moraxella bovis]UYZ71217.1 type II toxin-antitoxin system VapC family toxin [Moraxella bovis]
MKYLLDTNAVIAILNASERFLTTLERHKEREIAISSIVLSELYYGAYKSQKTAQNLEKINLLPFEVLQFNSQDADKAGEIGATLERRGTPIGSYDTLIAGQAIANDLIVITDNVREFLRVDGLQIESWLK